MRKPSPATELRNLKREVAMLRNDAARWKKSAIEYSTRAIAAEKEVVAWKQRFDALLKIVPADRPNH